MWSCDCPECHQRYDDSLTEAAHRRERIFQAILWGLALVAVVVLWVKVS